MRLPLLFLLGAITGSAQQEIPYSSPGGRQLVLDFYSPSGRGPYPAAILVPDGVTGAGGAGDRGGASDGGVRESVGRAGEEAVGGDFTARDRRSPMMRRLAELFQAAGVAVFCISYRAGAGETAAGAVEDVTHTAQWVRTHTREYSLDSRRIALVGQGAGAHLASLATVRGAPVAAVVAMGGWSDFRNQTVTPELLAFLGGMRIEEASPAMNITGGEPPFLLLHGDRDAVVPLEQSVHLQGALQAAGVPSSLVIIEGGGHDPMGWDALPATRPWEREMLIWLQKAFGRR